MKLGEILAQVPGLPRRFVYYLEAQGYIRPTRLPKQRIARREYSPADLETIRAIWQYYRQGYSLPVASALAAAQTTVYVLLRTPPRRAAEALALLQSADRVAEAGLVYGEDNLLVLRLRAAQESDVFAVLNPVFDQGAIAGVPVVLKTVRWVHAPLPETPKEQPPMLAYVLIKVPAKHADSVLEQLRQFPGIVEAAVVYGETDIITKIAVPSQAELDDLVIRRIQGLPQVESTRTFIVVGGMHWQRDQ